MHLQTYRQQSSKHLGLHVHVVQAGDHEFLLRVLHNDSILFSHAPKHWRTTLMPHCLNAQHTLRLALRK